MLLCEVKRMSNRVLVIAIVLITLVSFAVVRKKDARPNSEGQNITAASVIANPANATPSVPETPTIASPHEAVGEWIFRIAFGDSVVTVNADGTGSISDYPTTTFTWQSTGDGSFSATATKAMGSRKDFSARVVSDGRQLLITGWSPASGYFGTDKNTIVDRIK